jgi:hypothetical protein
MESNEIRLNEEQRTVLEQFSKSGVHSAMQIRRAKAILALDRSNKKDHLRIGRICESVCISRQGLNDIRKDFLESKNLEEFLKRKKRETPPVPPKVTGNVEAYIVALACTEPPSGYARWTVRLLAKRAVELHYADSLSHMSVERLLKKQNINLT